MIRAYIAVPADGTNSSLLFLFCWHVLVTIIRETQSFTVLSSWPVESGFLGIKTFAGMSLRSPTIIRSSAEIREPAWTAEKNWFRKQDNQLSTGSNGLSSVAGGPIVKQEVIASNLCRAMSESKPEPGQPSLAILCDGVQ